MFAGLSGLVAEMIQAAWDTGTQWLLDIAYVIVLCKKYAFQRTGNQVWFYKGKGDPMECGSYRGIKLLEHAVKVVEKIF